MPDFRKGYLAAPDRYATIDQSLERMGLDYVDIFYQPNGFGDPAR